MSSCAIFEWQRRTIKWSVEKEKFRRTLYLAHGSETKKTVQLSVGILWWLGLLPPLTQGRRMDVMQVWTPCYQPKICQPWIFLKWGASSMAQHASYFWNPSRSSGTTKSKSRALTRTGGLICQILARCCHQDCCRHSFIYKGCHPDLKIRSIITTRLSWSGDRWLSCVQYQDSMWHFCLMISPPLVKRASWLFLSCMQALIPKSYKVDLGPSFPFID